MMALADTRRARANRRKGREAPARPLAVNASRIPLTLPCQEGWAFGLPLHVTSRWRFYGVSLLCIRGQRMGSRRDRSSTNVPLAAFRRAAIVPTLIRLTGIAAAAIPAARLKRGDIRQTELPRRRA